MQKSEIRKKLINWRKELSHDEVVLLSKKIGVRLFSLSEFRQAKRIMFYVSYDNEVFTHDMIKHSLRYRKQVFVPISNVEKHTLEISELYDFEQELVPSTYGILEPKPEYIRKYNPNELELVIVPGIAFDEQGNRLGHGVGYYDNFLRFLSPHIITIGLAFSKQVYPSLPKTNLRRPGKKSYY